MSELAAFPPLVRVAHAGGDGSGVTGTVHGRTSRTAEGSSSKAQHSAVSSGLQSWQLH